MGSGNGEFNQIVGIATDSSNNVYVTDRYNLRVEKFTSDGDFVKSWGSDCQGARVFCSEPQGITTDTSDNVYVTEYNAGRVSKFTSDGNLILGWEVPSAYGIAVDRLGNVYISSGTDVIQVYVPTSDNTLPDTTITSVVDGDNNAISNGDSTVSTGITFTFEGTDSIATGEELAFECSLDGGSFESCTSPKSYTNLDDGEEHNFQVRAIDMLGNVDPIPDSFTWVILTPAQGIQKLVDTINSLDLKKSTQFIGSNNIAGCLCNSGI